MVPHLLDHQRTNHLAGDQLWPGQWPAASGHRFTKGRAECMVVALILGDMAHHGAQADKT
jgi:hypothetical protein